MKEKKINILILEDNSDDAELIVRKLQKNGFNFEWKRVETEKDFKKALSEKPDIILADFKLPSFDGMAAIKLQQEISPDIPLIIVTGTIGEELAVECIKAGASDYVFKDRLSRLSPVVKRALKESEEHRERKKAEEALQYSEERIRLLIENTTDMIIMQDLTGKYLYYNSPAIYGFNEKDMVGKTPYDFHPPEVAAQIVNRINRTVSTEQVINEEMKVDWQGETLWFLDQCSPVKDAMGKIIAVSTISRNITERKRAEQKTKESEQKFMNIFESANDSIVYLDIFGKIKDVNEQAVQAFGGTKEELINKHYTKIGIFSAKTIQYMLDNFKKAIHSEKFLLDLTITNKKGGNIDFECSSSRIKQKGKTTGIIVIARDITEYKQAEKALRESDKKYRDLFEKSEDAILIIHNGKFVDCNQATVNMLRYNNKGELLNTHPSELSPEKQPDGKMSFTKANEMMKMAFKNGSHRFEWNHKKSDGEVFPVEVLLTAISVDEKNQILHTIWRDITERKKVEEALRKSENNLRTLFNAMTDIVFEMDYDGRYINIAPTSPELMFKPPDKIVGRTLHEVFPKPEADRFLEFIRKCLDKNKINTIEYPLVIKDKTTWFEGRAIPKTKNSVLYIARDITEHKQAEKALRDSEEKYRDLTENMYDIVYSIDINGNLTYISPQVKRYGFEPEDILLKNLVGIIHPDDRGRAIEEFNKTIEEGAEFPSIFRINNAKGQTFWVEDIGKVQYDKDGNITGIAGVLRDITDRKQTEDLLQTQRDLALKLNEVKELDETLNLCLDAAIKISGMDCGGIYLINNETGSIDLAYHKGLPENFVKSASHFDAGSDNARLVMAGKAVYSQHQKLDVYINNNRKHENLRAIAVIPVLYEDKVIACFNIASHTLDETPAFARYAIQTIAAQIGSVIARINTQNELQASEGKYRQVVDNSLVGIYITQNHILKFCNQRFVEIFGYDGPKDILEKNIKGLVTTGSWNLIKKEVQLRESGEKIISRYEFKGIKKDGKKIDLEVLGGRIFYQGKPAIQGSLIDISERKKHEQELKIALERAEESDRLKSVFLNTMSHELRTPLNSVIGFSEMIDKNTPIDKICNFIKTINFSGKHLQSIVEDILDISMIESGEVKIQKEEHNISLIMQDIAGIMENEQEKSKKQEINIYFNYVEKDKDLLVYTDRNKLMQILINLLKNALKFTYRGYIEYGYIKETYHNEPILKFYVKDTGIGIPENIQNIIFDIFRQGDESSTRKFEGTGIGLTVSKKLIELLGGKIWVESEFGKGSTFYFTLPYCKPENFQEPPITEHIAQEEIKFPRKTILVAEDDIPSYSLLEFLLRKLEIKTIWAKDGNQVIELCKTNPDIDMVLMDIKMPYINGYEATKQIKKIRPDLPVIAQTAFAMYGDEIKAREAGCDDYISKPIIKTELYSLISKYL